RRHAPPADVVGWRRVSSVGCAEPQRRERMDQEIKIKALPIDMQRCRFTVDRPVLENRAVFFSGAAKAAGSPLAEALFALPDVSAVLVSHDTVTVTKTGFAEWPELARQVGAAIRSQVQSG